MTVTVYLPQDMSALRDEIALIHAEAAAKHVERLACPLEQKREVLRAVGEKGVVMGISRLKYIYKDRPCESMKSLFQAKNLESCHDSLLTENRLQAYSVILTIQTRATAEG